MSSKVVDESNTKKWRTELPNIIVKGSKSKISIYSKWLYVYLKSVAGEGGKCWQSTKTIADGSGISVGKVSGCKKELANANLISIEKGDVKKGNSDTIRIKDIWGENFKEYQSDYTPSSHEHPPSPSELTPSCSELTPSSHEPKKNPTKKEPLEENARESLTKRLQKAKTVQELSDIWFEYRKEKNKWPSITEREMKENEIKSWGFHKAKKIISKSIRKGWLSAEENYLSEEKSESERSPFRPDAIHL